MGSISPTYLWCVIKHSVTWWPYNTLVVLCAVQFPHYLFSIGGVVTVAAAIRFHPHPPAVFKPISLSSVLGVGGGSYKGGREVGCQALAWSKPTSLRNTFFDIWTSAGCGGVALSNPEAGLYFKTYQRIWAHLCQLHAFHSAAQKHANTSRSSLLSLSTNWTLICLTRTSSTVQVSTWGTTRSSCMDAHLIILSIRKFVVYVHTWENYRYIDPGPHTYSHIVLGLVQTLNTLHVYWNYICCMHFHNVTIKEERRQTGRQADRLTRSGVVCRQKHPGQWADRQAGRKNEEIVKLWLVGGRSWRKDKECK